MAKSSPGNQEIEISVPLQMKIDEASSKEATKRLEAFVDLYDELTSQREKLGKLDVDWAQKDIEQIDATLKKLNDEYKVNEKLIKQAKEFKQASGASEYAKGFFLSSYEGVQDKEQMGKNLKNTLVSGFKTGSNILLKALGTSWESLKSILSNTLGELDTMLKSSLLTDATTRENVFGYGMSAGESYGFTKAKDLLGISNTSDLAYMTDTQAKLFRESMIKYTNRYNELADKGFFDKMLEFNVQRQEFEEDLKLELIDFFMDNKDTIMTAMQAIITISEEIIKFIGSALGTGNMEAASNAVANYSNKNINVDTTFNLSGQMSSQDFAVVGTNMVDYMVSSILKGNLDK